MRSARRSILLGLLVAPALEATAQVGGLGGTLVVTNKQPSTATIIDVASGRALATLPTGAGPHEVVLSSDGRRAVVTDYGAQQAGRSLTVIDVAGLKVERTIPLDEFPRPHGVVFLPGDTTVAVTSEAARAVVVVDVRSGTVVKVASTGQAGSHMVGVASDGRRAWTGDIGSNTVTELDLVTVEMKRHIDVPAQPEAINVTPDGGEVWVGSNATGRVSVVDTRSGAVATAGEGFGWPYRMLFSPDSRLTLIPDYRKEELRILDRASKRELGRIAFPGGGPQGITITPDGRYALLSLSGEARVAIIDVAARRVVGHIAAGATPDGIAYTPRTAR